MKLRDCGIGPDNVRRLSFTCPGCGDTHTLSVGPAGRWQLSGDLARPTVAPSVLATCGHYCPGHESDSSSCWCTYRDEHGKPAPFGCYRCHSYIRDGRIEFLGDCSHALAGQTVELPEIPAETAK